MKQELLELLRCSECKSKFSLVVSSVEGTEIKEGTLRCVCNKKFQISNFIPRFVDNDDYLKSFSFEWKIHGKTQLDSANKNNYLRNASESAFQKHIDFPLIELKDKLVLDAGCGMGRYAEVASKFGANVIGVDYSFAVDVAFKNIGKKPNVHLIQADIFNLPFAPQTFDFIYSLGVLHHTPNPKAAFSSLPRLLKTGGKITITLYSAYQKIFVYNSKFWRLFTTRMPKKLLYFLCHLAIPLYYLYKIPVLGGFLKMVFIINLHPNWRWRVLDTFDWYSPKYQFWYTHYEVFKWFEEAGLRNIKVLEPGISFIGQRIVEA